MRTNGPILQQRLFTFLLVLCVHYLNAQKGEVGPIYLSGALQVGNYLGADLNLNYIHQSTYSFKIGIAGYGRKAKSRPADYSASLGDLFTLGTNLPRDQIETYQLSVGKIMTLNKQGSIRGNFSLGLAYTLIREPENWILVSKTSTRSNYTWDDRRQRTVSIILNPKIEFPFMRIYGLSISPLLVLNTKQIYFGIGIGQLIGVLRK